MPDYFVFGGCLRSELRFPELTETRGRAPNWTLRVGTLSQTKAAELLSDVELSAGCRIRVTRGEEWLRYAHSCTGTFEITAQGRCILFEPSAKCDVGGARTDFVARVLLHCVDHAAVTWLHGSAVRVGSGAIAFLGPSGAGKSTLALALARAGAEHICDDTLPIEAGARPTVWPTDHTIRLCSDSKGQLASSASATRRESDGKFVLKRSAFSAANVAPTPEALGAGRAPLAALYLLDPTEMSASAEPVTRRTVPPTSAIPALMRHLKLGLVVRPEDPARVVRQLGAIASSVPIFALSVSHDWSVLDEVVAEVLAWHAEPSLAVIGPIPALAVPA
jgi:hypothetical protein